MQVWQVKKNLRHGRASLTGQTASSGFTRSLKAVKLKKQIVVWDWDFIDNCPFETL